MNHAVLLQQVIVEFIRGDEALVMRSLVIYFNCHTPRTIFQHKISITAILINIIKMVLRIEISGLLCTESLAEQLYKQIFRNTTGSRMIGRHIFTSILNNFF